MKKLKGLILDISSWVLVIIVSLPSALLIAFLWVICAAIKRVKR